jgi:tellurite resistance protein
LDDENNQEELNGLEDAINNYFSLYVPDDEEFREIHQDNINVFNFHSKKIFTSSWD